MEIDNLKEISIGGVLMFCLLMLREAFFYLLKRDDKNAGAKDVAFWQLQYKESADRVIDEVTASIQHAENRVMRSVDDITDRQKKILDKVSAMESRRRTRND